MELLKKVTSLEVKRCFVLSQRFTSKKMRKEIIQRHIQKPIIETFTADFAMQKRDVLKMKESELDLIIHTEYQQRLKAYNSVSWYIGYAELSEIGLWQGGGIPSTWTKKSLVESCEKMSRELKKKTSQYARIRAMKAVPQIIKAKEVIKKEKYLLPIFLPGGTMLSCRKGVQKTLVEVDDGCMRSLAFAISGDKKIKAYIGVAIK